MKNRFVKISAVLCIVLVGIGALFLSRQDTAICDRDQLGLEASAPLELAALLNEDCMRVFARERPDEAADAMLHFGYPTLLLETQKRADVLELFSMLVTWGGPQFFADDHAILGRLADMRQTAEIQEISDFVAANQPWAQATYTPHDKARYLSFLPVWQNPKGQADLIDQCTEFECTESSTVCPSELGLSDKLDLVTGKQTLSDIIGMCPIDEDMLTAWTWIASLRRAGVIDTTCGSSTQTNAAVNNGLSLEEPCFAKDRQIGDYSGYGSDDVATFIKRKIQTGEPEVINAASLDIMFGFSPDITRYMFDE